MEPHKPLKNKVKKSDMLMKINEIKELAGLFYLPIAIEEDSTFLNIHAMVEWDSSETLSAAKRSIHYHPSFVYNTRKNNPQGEWEVIGLLAHEVGHHALQHRLKTEGRTIISEELKADEYAGYIVGLMGGSLEDALAYLNLLIGRPFATYPSLFQRGAAIAEGWAKGESTLHADETVGNPNMVFVKGGTFVMGCTEKQQGCDPTHTPTDTLTLSDFSISRYELSFREYDAYCEATGRDKPEDEGWGRGERPVINVSWYDAIEYCNWRSRQEGFKPCYEIYKDRDNPTNTAGIKDEKNWLISCDFGANGYRLPTETEWEYAARGGGKKVRFGNTKDIASPADMNFYALKKYEYSVKGICRKQTLAVSSFSPNDLGLYNMSGNVAEWCWDWFSPSYKPRKVDSRGNRSGAFRIIRGGAWNSFATHIKVSARRFDLPSSKDATHGFRLVRTLP